MRYLRSRGMAALLASWIAAPLPAQPSTESAIEPRTGIAFPATAPSGQKLLGIGVRTKTFLKIKVYAVGLYVDRTLDLPEASPGELGEPIRDGGMARSLRLVTARSIDGERMRGALTKATRARFDHARRILGLSGDAASWQAFSKAFDVETLPRGSEFWLSCSATDVMAIHRGEIAIATIPSAALCWALFDVYLGTKPISRDLKEALVARLEGKP